MSKPKMDQEAMVDKVWVRLDPAEMGPIDAICAREGRKRSDVVRLFVGLGLRLYPSFSSFTEIINLDLAGLAKRVLATQKSQGSRKRPRTQESPKKKRR